MNSPQAFDEKKYQQLLCGLECSEVRLSELERTARIDAEFYSKENLKIASKLIRYTNEPITKQFYISDGNHMSVSDDFRKEGIPYYRGQDTNNIFIENATPICISENYYQQPNMLRSHLKKNDILLSIVGTIGNTCMVYSNEKATCSCKLAILRPKNDTIKPFLIKIFLMSKYGQNQIKKFVRGAVQTGFLLEDMEQLIIPSFGDILGSAVQSLMEKIHLLIEQSNASYRAAEKILLSALNLENFTPTTENKSVKTFAETFASGRLDAEYYQKKYDEIEEKLSVFPQMTIKELIDYPVCSGSTPKARNAEYYTNKNNGIPFIRAVDIIKSRVDTENFIYIKPIVHNKLLKRTKLKKNDVLFSIAGTVGRCGIFDYDFEANINQAIAILRFSEEKVKRLYLVTFFNSAIGKMFVEKYSRQGLQTNLNLEEVSKLSFPILPSPIQQQISAKVKESFALREQSKTLLKAAVKAVEIAIEDGEEKAMEYLRENH